MYTLVFVRHGESVWNMENRFTGWKDVDLSARGEGEAREAGRMLKEGGFFFDVAYTSVLKRAIRTLHLIQEELDQLWIPEFKSWRLNERHYGALQGLNKSEMASQYGEEQVLIWRRSYDTPPPALTPDDERSPGHSPVYSGIPADQLPLAECLKDTVQRVLPFWDSTIAPDILSGKRLIIAAHGNSLRALVKYLDGLSEAEIMQMNIPTGIPLVYELDDQLKPIRHYYLADEEKLKSALEAVASQGKAKK